MMKQIIDVDKLVVTLVSDELMPAMCRDFLAYALEKQGLQCLDGSIVKKAELDDYKESMMKAQKEWEPASGDVVRERDTGKIYTIFEREATHNFSIIEHRKNGIAGGVVSQWQLREEYELIDRCENMIQDALPLNATVMLDFDTLSTEIKTNEQIAEEAHWQDVRERAAVAAMQGVMNFFGSIDYKRETIARLAVEQADALIKELRKEE